jgi:DNA-binding XRE family transcriptional regulator
VLAEQVAKCDVMLVIIGRQWATIADGSGQLRLDNPADFVRIEIEAALARGIPVIPVLVQNAPMPKVGELPVSLGDLAYRNGIIIHGDPYFHRDMDLLLGRLDALVINPPVSPPAKDGQTRSWPDSLKREREAHGWSQAALGKILNLDERTLQAWESGKRRPNPISIEKLCALYGKSARELGFPEASQP